MYWRAIGVSVATVFTHTYEFNQLYGRPIVPFGQVYGGATAGEIRAFRAAAAARAAAGAHWWDWQTAPRSAWQALGAPLPQRTGRVRTLADPRPTLVRGSRGDVVVWAQEHLLAAGWPVPVNGRFDAATLRAVNRFRAAAGLPPSGRIGAAAWAALLAFPVKTPAWSLAGRVTRIAGLGARPSAPWSARLPGRRGDAPRGGPGPG
jgi:peptidoglycan hydrolase-like protein with peptidoglycan-binding domain